MSLWLPLCSQAVSIASSEVTDEVASIRSLPKAAPVNNKPPGITRSSTLPHAPKPAQQPIVRSASTTRAQQPPAAAPAAVNRPRQSPSASRYVACTAAAT